MKILTVVGARPQFIKAAVVSRELVTRDGIDEVLVHTGQHFDENMSDVFFEELGLKQPDYNLGISGGSHAQMTARMLVALERVVLDEQPEAVLIYGDTNSTLAAALVASKLHIPIAHVEAGGRTRSLTNPEEINRLCADSVSSLLFACTQSNYDNLVREDKAAHALLVGDPMYDAFVSFMGKSRPPQLCGLDGESHPMPQEFYYLTCHREENTQDAKALLGVLDAMESLDAPTVYPVHPRNRTAVGELMESERYSNVIPVNPVGYLESIWLVSHAKQVVTDSGGLQREAFFAGVKCTTVLDFVVWPETMVSGRNLLAKPEKASILEAMGKPQHVDANYQPFGDGRSAVRIADALMQRDWRVL